MTTTKNIRITHRPTGEVITEGEKGWGLLPLKAIGIFGSI